MMIEQLLSDVSDDFVVVDKLRMNLKSHVEMINQNATNSFFNNIPPNGELSEPRNCPDGYKRQRFKSIELIPNRCEIPELLQQSDDEGSQVLSGTDSITCSRSTQTSMIDIECEPRMLQRHASNFPIAIGNGELSDTCGPSSSPFYQELMLTRSRLSSIYHNYEKMKTRFYKLHADYEKLMGITAELTTSLENSIRGQTVDESATLLACMKIYPEFFQQNVRNNDRLESSVSEWKIDRHEKNFRISMLSTVPLSPKDLNYKKIKLHLIHGNIRTKLLLLQALRWKITLSQPGERDEAIIEYIRNDLLGIHGQIAGDSGKSILPYTLIPIDMVAPHPVQQSAARLLNTFASFKCGRDYLSVGPNVLNVVIQCLDSTHAESIDAFTCDMIIATLQKLSLRTHQRLYMISAGMIEWLIHHLKAECHSMGTYRLEYATALLMNLSLHKEAQIRVAAIATVLLSTLITLMSSQHLPALPYVYGALNNFLANSAINEEGNAIGLKSILEHHRNYRSGELRTHLDHILLKYRRKFTHMTEEEMNNDDDREENDILDDELDELDSVKVHPGELFGEGLLATCYSIAPYVEQRNGKKLNNGSSSDVSYKTGDELNRERADERLFEDRFLSFHCQKLSPRESSELAVNSGMNISSRLVNSVIRDGDVVDERMSSIASLDVNYNDTPNPGKTGVTEEEEAAFAAKPRISRTPPVSVLPTEHCALAGTNED